jgi:hypothetical protein
MTKQFITAAEAIALLRKMQGGRTNVAFAAEIGIGSVYLGDIYSGRRSLGPKVASFLGLTLETVYRKAA